jgi:hypothetical protein
MLCPSCSVFFVASGVLPATTDTDDSVENAQKTSRQKCQRQRLDNGMAIVRGGVVKKQNIVSIAISNANISHGTSPVSYKKHQMSEVSHESWACEFSADVPIHFLIVTGVNASGISRVLDSASSKAVVAAADVSASPTHVVVPVTNETVESHAAIVEASRNNVVTAVADEAAKSHASIVDASQSEVVAEVAGEAKESHASIIEALQSDVGAEVADEAEELQDSVHEATSSGIVIRSFLDIVNMSAHVCCGYRFRLQLVDLINRVGHATIMKSNSHNEVIASFCHLMQVARVEPKVVYYDNQFSFIATVQDEYPLVSLVLMFFSDVMVRERALYILQMQRWIEGFGKKWLCALTTI